jgi:hypothetical protein
MDEGFKRNRLERLERNHLVAIIRNPRNANFFPDNVVRDLERLADKALIDLILAQPNAYIDNNILADYRHQTEAAAFDRLYALALQSKQQRARELQALSREQLAAIFQLPVNLNIFGNLATPPHLMTREQLVDMFLKHPESTLTGNPMDRSYDPEYWKARPHQEDNIQTITEGLLDPTNEARCALNGSEMGKGKTAATILTLIKLKCYNIVVVCPDAVIKKWHEHLNPLGLFNYRLCTYAGIKSTEKAPVRYAKHKPDPNKLTYSVDMDWVRVTDTGLKGIHDANYDWSFLPDADPQTGLGGCVVVWDEVQNAKGASKTGVCFTQFITYLHREPSKFVRSIFLSGSVMEKPDDLPYLMHALGYISNASKGEQNNFVRLQLGANFRQWLGDDWRPEEHANITDAGTKLILFFRIVARRQKKFSWIPDPIPYALQKMGMIARSDQENLTEYVNTVLIPNFRNFMEEDWRPEFEALDGKGKLLKFLSHLSKDPRYAGFNLADIVEKTFDNPITFQGLQVRDEDLGQFIRINREIEALLLEIVRGNKKFDAGILGSIQRTLSELEVLKLTPFIELARKALTTSLANGAQGSVIISMLRNASVRHFAWRLEAILFIEHLKTLNLSSDQLNNIRATMISRILKEYENYAAEEKFAMQTDQALKIKSTFQKYTFQQLAEMSFEDLTNEFNKWTKYLDVDAFEYVCIFVSDFGNPNPTDFDLESDDVKDHVKESKSVNRRTKENMKEIFQLNQRRVFLTNMQIAREGIDLHDTSTGGMHPRTVIISPGIVARYLIQMLGRAVRDGQTSESLRIVGYVDNVKGNISWEARFMEKLSRKVKDIQILHTGEASLDILDNIDKDGRSILREIVDEIRMGQGYLAQDAPVVDGPIPPVESPAVSGRRDSVPIGEALRPVPAGDTLGAMFQQTLGGRSRSGAAGISPTGPGLSVPSGPGFQIGQKAQLSLSMFNNSTHILFQTKNVSLTGFEARIVEVLTKAGMDPIYYRVLGPESGNYPGVLIYRPGFLVSGISQTEMVGNIERAIGVPVVNQPVAEGHFSADNLNPAIKIRRLLVVFENPTTFYAGPAYPLSSLFPADLTGPASLTIDQLPGGLLRFTGTPARIVAAYYAIKMLTLFEAPGIFESFVTNDPVNVLTSPDARYKFRSFMRDGQYVVEADRDLLRLLAIVLGAYRQLVPLIREGRVLLIPTYKEEATGMASVVVAPEYHDLVTRLLGRSPEESEKK